MTKEGPRGGRDGGVAAIKGVDFGPPYVGPEADAARQEARATSERLKPLSVDCRPRLCPAG